MKKNAGIGLKRRNWKERYVCEKSKHKGLRNVYDVHKFECEQVKWKARQNTQDYKQDQKGKRVKCVKCNGEQTRKSNDFGKIPKECTEKGVRGQMRETRWTSGPRGTRRVGSLKDSRGISHGGLRDWGIRGWKR